MRHTLFDCIFYFLRNPFLPRVVRLPSALFINSFVGPKEHNNVSGYVFLSWESAPYSCTYYGMSLCIGQSSIASANEVWHWLADQDEDVLAPWLLPCSSTLPDRQELTRGAKDGKLGVMTSQLPDHSNLSRTIQPIATTDCNGKTAGRCPSSSFGSIYPTPRSRRHSRVCV
jgi:hypothetical protein